MITFAIPYYRGAPHLRAALQSVRDQSTDQWRVLVCDDGDEAGTQALVAKFADERISYIKNPARLGMVGNWNQCLTLATSDLVTLLHGDDALLPGYAEALLQAARSNPDAIALFPRAKVIGPNGENAFSLPDLYKRFLIPSNSKPIRLQGEEGLRSLLRGNFIFCPSVCFRKSALGDRRFSEKWKMVQDLDLWTQLLLEGKTLVGIPDMVYAYRRHDTNTTVEYTRNLLRFEEEAQIYAELAGLLTARGWTRAAKVARQARIVRLNLGFCALKDLLAGDWNAVGQKLRFLQGLGRNALKSK